MAILYDARSNQEAGAKDYRSGVVGDVGDIRKYAVKIKKKGVFYSAREAVFLIETGITSKWKESCLAVKFDTGKLTAKGNYIVEFVFADEIINKVSLNQADYFEKTVESVKEFKRLEDFYDVAPKTEIDDGGTSLTDDSEKLWSEGIPDDYKNIVCSIVDSLLDKKSVVLYRSTNDVDDDRAQRAIYYALRSLPVKFANSISINTDINLEEADNEQFIGYLRKARNDEGVAEFVEQSLKKFTAESKKDIVYINIHNEDKTEYNCFYSAYLDWAIKNSSDEKLAGSLERIFSNIASNLNNDGIIDFIEKTAAAIVAGKNKNICRGVIVRYEIEKLKKISDNEYAAAFHEILYDCLMKNRALTLVKMCNETKIVEQFDISDETPISIDEDSVLIEELNKNPKTVLKQLSRFYFDYVKNVGPEKKEKYAEFIHKIFELSLGRIKNYSDEMFNAVYECKIRIGYDGNMGCAFFTEAHNRYKNAISGDGNSAKAKADMTKEAELNENKKNKNKTEKSSYYKQSPFYAVAITTAVILTMGILFVCMIPDKVWVYLSIIMNVDSWFIMPGLFIIVAAAFVSLYLGVYGFMRKNTVHLNGTSNGYSICVSFLSVAVAIFLPVIIFVTLGVSV